MLDLNHKYLILAMFIQVLLPVIAMFMMFRRKVSAVKRGEVKARAFKLNLVDNQQVPEELVLISNHYNNLFQMPLIFLVVGVLFISLRLVDNVVVFLGWFYVLTRIAHSIIHLGSNYVPYRYISFGLSSLILIIIWLYLLGKIFF